MDGRGSSGVLIVGTVTKDTYGDFHPSSRTGSLLERAIRRISTTRDMFWLLESSDPTTIRQAIETKRPRAVLALGNELLSGLTGLGGAKLTVSQLTGYVLPAAHFGYPPVIPCFHPSFLRGGHMALFGVLMRCIRLAMQVAKEQRQPLVPPVEDPPSGYLLHPTEDAALQFERSASTTKGYLAYDLETYYANDEEEGEEEISLGRKDIRSIQFSLGPGTGIFLPWREPFIDIARRTLELPVTKINWNGWRFDDPLLRDADCRIAGQVIDLMWAWHHAQPDLPRGLQFAAAMQGPRIHSPSHSWPWPWKHMSGAHEQFYGIVDVDVLQWLVSY